MNRSKKVEDALEKWLKGVGRIVIVGVGNELRRDDFVGVKIVRDLKGKVPKSVMLIESETVPESFIEPITKFNPTHILLIDAGLLGLKPGEIKLLESSQALGPPATAISTHTLPLRVFCEYLENTINTKIALIIIQPKNTHFGEKLSKEIRTTAEETKKTLLKLLHKQ